MPTTTATLDYRLLQVGPTTSASLQARMALVPVPTALLAKFGVRLISDTIVPGPPILRRLVLGLTQSADPAATVILEPSTPTGSPVIGFNVSAPGDGFVAPPIVSVAGGKVSARALLKAVTTTVGAGGSGYAATTTAQFFGGIPLYVAPNPGVTPKSPARTTQSFKRIFSVNVTAPGANYSPQTIAVFSGGLAPVPPGLPAQGTAIVRAGQIVGVKITDPGEFYVGPPKVTFVDPTGAGSGATATVTLANMVAGTDLILAGRPATANLTIDGGGHVTAITLTDGGIGYVSPPTVMAVDPTGAGDGLAAFVATLGVGEIDVLDGGTGFQGAPAVTFTPLFKSLFPDSGDQRGPFWDLLTTALNQVLEGQVLAAPPLIA